MNIVMDVFIYFFNCRQTEKQILQDYTRIFQVDQDISKLQIGGEIVLQRYIEAMPDCNESNKARTEQLTKFSQEQLAAYGYLVNADHEKYVSVIKGLHSQEALDNDKY